MSILQNALENGKFGVTAEMAPPKGYDFTEQMEKIAFMVIEDDGGTTTSWKCSAVVKYNSKAYGFELDIPYKDKDDIVWRGQLTRNYFDEVFARGGGTLTGRFGDVEITFALE